MHWTVHLEGGPRRVNHAAVCIDDRIFSFGGYCSSEDYRDWEPIPVHVFNTQNLRWSVVEYDNTRLVPFQRYGHTAVAFGDKVYMWGGRNNAIACDILCCFDTKTLKWSTPAVTGSVPFAKDGHSACVINNKMYIFGGFEYLTDQYSQEVHSLDLITFRWDFVLTKGTPPSHRDFHSATAVGNRMYIFGGRGDLNSPFNSEEEIYCPDLFYLDISTNEWVSLCTKGDWPEGRRSHSAWLYGDDIYIFGGYNGNVKDHYNDLYRYSTSLNCWQLLIIGGTAPCKRRRQACVVHGSKMYLFGGTSPQKMLCNTTDIDENNTENLLDNSDLHILDYAPTLKTLAIMVVLEHNLDTSALPQNILWDIRAMTVPNKISRPINNAG